MLLELEDEIERFPHPAAALQNLGLGFQWKHEGVEAITPGNSGDDVTAGCEWAGGAGGVRGVMSITNSGTADVTVSEIRWKFRLITETGLDKVFLQSWTMSGCTGLRDAAGECRSSGVMGWSNGSVAAAAGFLDHSAARTRVDAVRIDERTWQVTATVFREGVTLAPGTKLTVSPFWLQSGPELSALLRQYAVAVSTTMGARKKKPAESGWCSWYYFYGKETFDQVVSCAEELAASPLAPFLRTIQIDDGWNRALASDLPEAWGDWEAHPDKFPSGMAEAARKIHALGFRAGLWLAPFSVAGKSRLFSEHPDWLVQQRDTGTGKMSPAPTADNPDIFQLDCTHPLALEWLRTTFHRVFSEWKFDYIKIDFLLCGAGEGGIRHDPSATSIEAYRRGLAAINEVADDDKFILACGAPLLASVGLVDGMRVGPDVGGRWLFDPGWPDWPVGNCSLRAAALTALWSQWMHGHLWQNDPDCIVVRDAPTRYECDAIGRFEKETALKNPDYLASPLGLSDEEAGLWARLVWMTGGMALLSEVWSELPAGRRDIISKCFPAHGRKVSEMDWSGAPDDVAALVAEGALVGVFNFGDAPCQPAIPAEKLGLSGHWSLHERWSGETIHGEGTHIVFPELPPHSGRIWEMVS